MSLSLLNYHGRQNQTLNISRLYVTHFELVSNYSSGKYDITKQNKFAEEIYYHTNPALNIFFIFERTRLRFLAELQTEH